MRPLNKIHCVIPRFSRTTLQKAPALARSQPSNSRFHSLYVQTSAPRSRLLTPRASTRRRPYPSTIKPTHSPTTSIQSSKPAIASQPPSSPFSTTSLTMSSDDAYMSFLDKANADLNAGRAAQQGGDTVRTETVDANVKVPKPLQSVDAYYISDSDEPFEPVALKWDGARKGDWPSPGTFFLLPSLSPGCFLRVPPCCFGVEGWCSLRP